MLLDLDEINKDLTTISDGTHISYYSNKKIKEIKTIKNGVIDGEYMFYNHLNVLVDHMEFKDDMLHGFYYQYYSDGNPMIECTMNMGKIHGFNVEWYDSNKLKLKCYYNNGKLYGEYIQWNFNGDITKHEYILNRGYGNKIIYTGTSIQKYKNYIYKKIKLSLIKLINKYYDLPYDLLELIAEASIELNINEIKKIHKFVF